MLWQRLTKTSDRRTIRPSAVRFRPNLDALEDRTLLTITTFFLDNTQAYLTVSGSLSGVNLQAQDSQGASLTTVYEGDLQADVDFTNGLITFNTNGDGAIADDSGYWQPKDHGAAGTDLANYGAKISFLGTGYAAVRNFVAGQDSDTLPLTQDDAVTWEFPSAQHFTILSGVADYTHPLLSGGQFDLSGYDAYNQAPNPGYLIDINGDGSVYELYAQVDFTINGTLGGIPYMLNLDGFLVGYGSPGTGPARGGAAKGTPAVFNPDVITGGHSPEHAPLAGSLDTVNTVSSGSAAEFVLTASPSSTAIHGVDTGVTPLVHAAQAIVADPLDTGLQPLGG